MRSKIHPRHDTPKLPIVIVQPLAIFLYTRYRLRQELSSCLSCLETASTYNERRVYGDRVRDVRRMLSGRA